MASKKQSPRQDLKGISTLVDQEFGGLSELARAIATAQRQCNLYGVEHPNAASALNGLMEAFCTYFSINGVSTCIFTDEGIVAQEKLLPHTPESKHLHQRLRARGVMAFSVHAAPQYSEILGWLRFLNEDTQTIRLRGPVTYLADLNVISLTLTPSIYAKGSEGSEPAEASEKIYNHNQDIGNTVADILCKLAVKGESDSTTHLPLAEILADPVQAAALLSDAIATLNASGYEASPGQTANEVLHHIKDMCADSPENWDNAESSLREAVASLPAEWRPTSCGLITTQLPRLQDSDDVHVDVEVAQVEAQVRSALHRVADGAAPEIEFVEAYIGSRGVGLMSAWQAELDPSSHLAACAQTYATLLLWETNATAHGEIADSLTAFLPPALEDNDFATALKIGVILMREAQRDGEGSWRFINVRTSLRGLDQQHATSLLEHAASCDTPGSLELAEFILRIISEIAPSLLHFLGNPEVNPLLPSLKKALLASGAGVLPALRDLAWHGSAAARDAAIEILSMLPSPSDLQEITTLVASKDPFYVINTITTVYKVNQTIAETVCERLLDHDSVDVRCMAIETLGKSRNHGVLDLTLPFTIHKLFGGPSHQENISACRALGNRDESVAREALIAMANRRVWLGRTAYELVRSAARTALVDQQMRRSQGMERAA